MRSFFFSGALPVAQEACSSKALLHMRTLNKLISLMFISHFAVLFIYLTGDLELLPKEFAKYTKWTNKYVNPFFEQNWGMFAPNPPTSNLHVFVQYIIPEANSKKYSTWYDIYSPVISQNHHSYFSLNQRLLKYFHGCTMEVYNAGFEDTTTTSKVGKTAHIRNSYGYQSLKKYARISYNSLGQPALSKDVKFRFKFINVYFPSFRDREKSYYDESSHEYSVLQTAVDKL